MPQPDPALAHTPETACWYALRVRKPFEMERVCQEMEDVTCFLPKVTVWRDYPGGKVATVIPFVAGLAFLKTTEGLIAEMEKASREYASTIPFFTVYRNIAGDKLQPVREDEIRLMRILCGENFAGSEPYNKTDFRKGMAVKVTEGPFKGYQGWVRKVKAQRRVVVEIEGVCALLLPEIAPEFLKKAPNDEDSLDN